MKLNSISIMTEIGTGGMIEREDVIGLGREIWSRSDNTAVVAAEEGKRGRAGRVESEQ